MLWTGRGPSRVGAALARVHGKEKSMHRRLWLSVAMLVTGASLLVASSFASAAGNAGALKKGGIWKSRVRPGLRSRSTRSSPTSPLRGGSSTRPQRSSTTIRTSPGPAGSKLVPEVASRFTVRNGGKKYTFFIRKGFKFSDGTAVTANSFKYAINRTANKDLASPGAQFITDPTGTNIVGAAGGQCRKRHQRLRCHRSRATSSRST